MSNAISALHKQDRQCTCNIVIWHVHIRIVVVEEQ
jgi:hypothetical protein